MSVPSKMTNSGNLDIFGTKLMIAPLQDGNALRQKRHHLRKTRKNFSANIIPDTNDPHHTENKEDIPAVSPHTPISINASTPSTDEEEVPLKPMTTLQPYITRSRQVCKTKQIMGHLTFHE